MQFASTGNWGLQPKQSKIKVLVSMWDVMCDFEGIGVVMFFPFVAFLFSILSYSARILSSLFTFLFVII